jgi:hypothetical protein
VSTLASKRRRLPVMMWTVNGKEQISLECALGRKNYLERDIGVGLLPACRGPGGQSGHLRPSVRQDIERKIWHKIEEWDGATRTGATRTDVKGASSDYSF